MDQIFQDDFKQIDAFPQGKLYRITYDPVVKGLRILSKTRDMLEEVRRVFSVENKAAFFSQQYGYKGEPRLYNINAFGYFYSCLVWKILDWIKQQYGTLDVVAISKNCAAWMRQNLRPLAGIQKFEIDNVSDDTGRNAAAQKEGRPQYTLRDYQREAVERLLFDGQGRGLIQIPTAGGKSFILANFIWNVLKHIDQQCKFCILVPNVQLVEQFYKDLLDYGYEKQHLAKFEGGMTKKQQRENDVQAAKIVIANRQYVFKNASKLPQFGCLICDEVHQFLSESSADLVQKTGAAIKIGCSGTIPSDKYLRNQLIGMFGDIAFSKKITDLQDDGFISKLHITSVEVFDRRVESDRNLLFNMNSTRKYRPLDDDNDLRFDDAVKAEHEYFSKWYEDLYGPIVDYASKFDGNTLFLFDKIDVGSSLYELFQKRHPEAKSYYNDGQTKVAEREDTRSEFEKTDGNFLFANVQILSTGISIKRLHNIVFCFSSKSTTRIIQSIGRALRLYSDKSRANLYDVHFNFKYSNRHYKERLQMYGDFYGKKKPDDTIRFEI